MKIEDLLHLISWLRLRRHKKRPKGRHRSRLSGAKKTEGERPGSKYLRSSVHSTRSIWSATRTATVSEMRVVS